MVTSILIIVFSLVLLMYWFRYTCLLILRTRAPKDFSAEVAEANRLAYPLVRERLQQAAELDPLAESLAHDYRLLSYLLRHTVGLQMGGMTIEQRMLSFDFQLMRVWYALTRNFATSQARFALQEMSDILGHFANAMGERTAVTRAY